MPYVAFGVFLSLSKVHLKFNHVGSFALLAGSSPVVWMYRSAFIHWPVGAHLGCFQPGVWDVIASDLAWWILALSRPSKGQNNTVIYLFLHSQRPWPIPKPLHSISQESTKHLSNSTPPLFPFASEVWFTLCPKAVITGADVHCWETELSAFIHIFHKQNPFHHLCMILRKAWPLLWPQLQALLGDLQWQKAEGTPAAPSRVQGMVTSPTKSSILGRFLKKYFFIPIFILSRFVP